MNKNDKKYPVSVFKKRIKMLSKKISKKFDFCKCTLGEMKMMTENILKSYNANGNGYLPVVSIGHSKDFIYKKDFDNFLRFLRSSYSDVIEIIPINQAAKKYFESSSVKFSSNKSNLPN